MWGWTQPTLPSSFIFPILDHQPRLRDEELCQPSRKASLSSLAVSIVVRRKFPVGLHQLVLINTEFRSTRFIIFDNRANIIAQSQKEYTQYYPNPG